MSAPLDGQILDTGRRGRGKGPPAGGLYPFFSISTAPPQPWGNGGGRTERAPHQGPVSGPSVPSPGFRSSPRAISSTLHPRPGGFRPGSEVRGLVPQSVQFSVRARQPGPCAVFGPRPRLNPAQRCLTLGAPPSWPEPRTQPVPRVLGPASGLGPTTSVPRSTSPASTWTFGTGPGRRCLTLGCTSFGPEPRTQPVPKVLGPASGLGPTTSVPWSTSPASTWTFGTGPGRLGLNQCA